METRPGPGSGRELGLISTEWALVFDPVHFVKRYAPAIQTYLAALVRNRHDAEEVAQNFFLRVTEHGFPRAKRERGRFRDYLKVAVRNAALNFLQRQKPKHLVGVDLAQLAGREGAPSVPDQEWIIQWRDCLLQRAWQALEEHQKRFPQTFGHTALWLKASRPKWDSELLSDQASAILGRPIQPEAFRKQVSRARRLFAELLVKEVAQTLDQPTPELIEEELSDVGLIIYVRDYLPSLFGAPAKNG